MNLHVGSPTPNQQVQPSLTVGLPVSGTASSGTNAEPIAIVSVTIHLGQASASPAPVKVPNQNLFTFSAQILPVVGVGPSHVSVTAVDDNGVKGSLIVPITLIKPSPPPPPPVDTTGQLTFVRVSDGVQPGVDFATFGLLAAGTETIFEFGPNPSAPAWIIHAAELAMLREALVHKLQVTVTHDPASTIPMLVKVMAPP